jgi:phage I-like protein
VALQRSLFATASTSDIVAICRNAAPCSISLSADNKAPEWIQVIPAGPDIEALDGRTFQNTDPAAIVAAFENHPIDIPIDWEHATQRKAPKGEKAPAAGWIKRLEVRDGSVWGRVDWTPQGAADLASKEYRYFSPAFGHNLAGIILSLVSGGLTNEPAFVMQAVARADSIGMAAQWTAADINDLPDNAFLYIEGGGTKDSGGRTVPRGLRHFPYRGPDDALDVPHLRNAIARIPQAKISGLSADALTRLQDKARKLLDKENASATASAQHTEAPMDPKLITMLGLTADATADQVLSAIATMKAAREKSEADLVTARTEVATARSSPPSLDKFVPRADYEVALARAGTAETAIAEGKKAARQKEIDTEIDAALKAGKIVPASKDFYIATCSAEGGLERFRDFVKIAPTVGAPSGLDDKQLPGSDDVMGAQEIAIASKCGVTKEQYLAELKYERQRQHKAA